MVATPTHATQLERTSRSILLILTSTSAPSTSTALPFNLPSHVQLIPVMGWPSREDVIRQMGFDTAQWRAASELQDLLSTLENQQRMDPDAKDVKGDTSAYSFASQSMFRYTFHTVKEPFYDRRRKCLWYLGWRVSSLISFELPS